MPTSSHAKFLQEARTFVESAINSPEIAAELVKYGYTTAKLQAGLALIAEAEALARRKAVEYGEKYEALAKLGKAKDEANILYRKAWKTAQVALRAVPKAAEALGFNGPRNLSVSGWYEQAGDFFANLLDEPEYVHSLEEFGYTRERLEDEKRVVDAVMDTRDEKTIEAVQAKASTQARDRKIAEVDAWISDLRAICEVAFYDDRSKLEALGPLAPTFRHAGKKKPVAAAKILRI